MCEICTCAKIETTIKIHRIFLTIIYNSVPMLEACHHRKVKVIISSAGGCGSDASVDYFVDIINEVAQERGYHFKVRKSSL